METQTIYKYECTSEEWTAFIDAMRSGETVEVDEEMFYYWLEVLPPIYMHKIKEIDGQMVKVAFGFAEGREPVVDFWRKDGKFYCKCSNIINQWA